MKVITAILLITMLGTAALPLKVSTRSISLSKQASLNSKNDTGQQLVIVDTDLGLYGDDSMSLCILLQSRALKILGITTTSGNVWSEEATVNALNLLPAIEHTDIPVHPGLPAIVHVQRLRFYQNVEAKSSAKGVYSGALKLGTRLPPVIEKPGQSANLSQSTQSAPDFIIEQVMKYPGKVAIVLFGPGTNLAAAIRKNPRAARQIARVFVSGGAIHVAGNTTKAAEFNFWFDPKSANEVVSGPFPVTLLPLDATEGHFFEERMIKFFAGVRSPMGEYLNEYFQKRLERRKGRAIPLWDEALAGVIIDPKIVTSQHRQRLRVITRYGPQFGAVRTRGSVQFTKRKPVEVVEQLDVKRLHSLIYQLFSN